MRRFYRAISANVALAALTTLAAACGGGGGGGPGPGPTPVRTASPTPVPSASPTPVGLTAIKHVVIIIQENRTFDNLFNGYPGADTAQSGTMSNGQTIALRSQDWIAPADISHAHTNWWKQYANGNLYFDLGSPASQSPSYPYAYTPQSETVPYWTLAQQYVLADRMFQTNTGPSFVAHLYLIAATSEYSSGHFADENPNHASIWGCDDPSGVTVQQLGPNGTSLPGPFPCLDYTTLADEFDAKGISWRYYAPSITGTGGSIWSAFDAISHLRFA